MFFSLSQLPYYEPTTGSRSHIPHYLLPSLTVSRTSVDTFISVSGRRRPSTGNHGGQGTGDSYAQVDTNTEDFKNTLFDT